MKTVNPDQHAARRLEILDSARSCFSQSGFHQTSTADICARAGISSGKLFHYYPSKKALIVALVEQEGQETLAYFQQAKASSDPCEEIRRFLSVVAELAADPAYARLTLEIAAEAGRDADIAALVQANDRTLRTQLADLLRTAVRLGRVRPVLGIKDVADALALLSDGLFTRVMLDPAFDPIRQLPALLSMADGLLGQRGE